MAIKITTSIGYKKKIRPYNELTHDIIGTTNEAYLFIDSVSRNKEGNLDVYVKTFKSKTERDADIRDTAELQIKSNFSFTSDNPNDYTPTLGDFFGSIYVKIAEELYESGLSCIEA